MFAKIAAAAVALTVSAAGAAEAGRYENARFGYVVEPPPGFSAEVRPRGRRSLWPDRQTARQQPEGDRPLHVSVGAAR